ncbi:MAG: hypothetical protein ACREO3_04835 [Arenimonas sp.]
MKIQKCSCGLLTALAMLASPAAIAQEPLRYDLAPLVRAAPAAGPSRATPAQRAAQRRSFNVPQSTVLGRDRRLTDRRETRQEVLSSLGVSLLAGLEAADTTTTSTPTAGYPELRFKKQGHLARDIKRGYRNMGENLARKVFDDPKGKRVVFDIQGRPGVGIEIPLR